MKISSDIYLAPDRNGDPANLAYWRMNDNQNVLKKCLHIGWKKQLY
jgi:hypothetical protein